MSKTYLICILLLVTDIILALACFAPNAISDHNEFLKGFVRQDFLAILGVILAITLASASQVHLKFNDLEEREGKRFLMGSRREVSQDTYGLLWSFVVAIIIVLAKSYVAPSNYWVAVANGYAIAVLLFNVAILFDITGAVFAIQPSFQKDAKCPPDQ